MTENYRDGANPECLIRSAGLANGPIGSLLYTSR